MQSRKHDSITDEDVACLLAPGHDDADRAGTHGHRVPRPALRRPPRHRRRVLRPAGRQSSPPRRSSSSGSAARSTMGVHRFIHTLDVFGTDPPVIAVLTRPSRRGQGHRAGDDVSTILVTGATGLTGANVCRLLDRPGRPRPGPGPPECRLRAVGRAGRRTGQRGRHRRGERRQRRRRVRRRIHCAALLGGAEPGPRRIRGGERHRHRATSSTRPQPAGMRRVVAVSTGTFFDTTTGVDRRTRRSRSTPAPTRTR